MKLNNMKINYLMDLRLQQVLTFYFFGIGAFFLLLTSADPCIATANSECFAKEWENAFRAAIIGSSFFIVLISWVMTKKYMKKIVEQLSKPA